MTTTVIVNPEEPLFINQIFNNTWKILDLNNNSIILENIKNNKKRIYNNRNFRYEKGKKILSIPEDSIQDYSIGDYIFSGNDKFEIVDIKDNEFSLKCLNNNLVHNFSEKSSFFQHIKNPKSTTFLKMTDEGFKKLELLQEGNLIGNWKVIQSDEFLVSFKNIKNNIRIDEKKSTFFKPENFKKKIENYLNQKSTSISFIKNSKNIIFNNYIILDNNDKVVKLKNINTNIEKDLSIYTLRKHLTNNTIPDLLLDTNTFNNVEKETSNLEIEQDNIITDKDLNNFEETIYNSLEVHKEKNKSLFEDNFLKLADKLNLNHLLKSQEVLEENIKDKDDDNNSNKDLNKLSIIEKIIEIQKIDRIIRLKELSQKELETEILLKYLESIEEK